jgi:hypothetical protein
MTKASRLKPKKPHPAFPFTAHANGQWCRKIRGKMHFFGVWAEPETSLKRHLAAAADLHAGRQPPLSKVPGQRMSVKDVCNAFLGWQKDKVEAAEIGPRWFEDCRRIASNFAKTVGKARSIDDLRPEDFQRYRAGLAKSLGVHALSRHITVIRSIFKCAYDSGAACLGRSSCRAGPT